jgi:hypothetical protein
VRDDEQVLVVVLRGPARRAPVRPRGELEELSVERGRPLRLIREATVLS